VLFGVSQETCAGFGGERLDETTESLAEKKQQLLVQPLEVYMRTAGLKASISLQSWPCFHTFQNARDPSTVLARASRKSALLFQAGKSKPSPVKSILGYIRSVIGTLPRVFHVQIETSW